MVAAPHTLATTTLTCPYPPHRTMLEVHGPTRAPPLVPKRVLPREVLGSTLSFVPRHSFCALPSPGCLSSSHWSKGRPVSALSQGCRSHAWSQGCLQCFVPNVVWSLVPIPLPRTPSPSPPLHSFRRATLLTRPPRLPFPLALFTRPPRSPSSFPPARSPSSLALPTRRGFLLLIPTGKQAIKGQFITLVKQGGIPATFLLSILVLKKRYHTIHYVGCVGVLLGIALVVAPSLADAPVDNWWYIIPLVLSTIPMAGSSVTQEIVLQVRVTLALERGAALYMYDVQVQRSMHTGTLQYDILLRTET